MNRTMITGDTHGEIDLKRFSTKRFPEGRLLDKTDVIIVAGDFGLLWKNEPDKTEKYYTKWLTDKKWITCFVCGNHENFTRLNALPIVEKFGGKVGMINDSIYHLRRGEVYTINGNKIFCFGGALSVDKSSRREYISWWPEEQPTYAEQEYALQNLEKHNYDVDYIVCHNGPRSALDVMRILPWGINFDPICKFLDHISSTVKFKRFFFGHHHQDTFGGKYHCLFNDIVELENRQGLSSRTVDSHRELNIDNI